MKRLRVWWATFASSTLLCVCGAHRRCDGAASGRGETALCWCDCHLTVVR